MNAPLSLLLALLLISLPASGETVWTVTWADENGVTAQRVEGDRLRIGDPVLIYFHLKGIEARAIKGFGKVTSAKDGRFTIQMEKDTMTGRPQPGDKVSLESGKPRGTQAAPQYRRPRPTASKTVSHKGFLPPSGWLVYQQSVRVATTKGWRQFTQEGDRALRVAYYLPASFQKTKDSFAQYDDEARLQLKDVFVVELGRTQTLLPPKAGPTQTRRVFEREIAWSLSADHLSANQEEILLRVRQGQYAICFQFSASSGYAKRKEAASEMLTVLSSAHIF